MKTKPHAPSFASSLLAEEAPSPDMLKKAVAAKKPAKKTPPKKALPKNDLPGIDRPFSDEKAILKRVADRSKKDAGVVDSPAKPVKPKKVKAEKPAKPVRCFARLEVVMRRAKEIQAQQDKNQKLFDTLYARSTRHPKWAEHCKTTGSSEAFSYADVLA